MTFNFEAKMLQKIGDNILLVSFNAKKHRYSEDQNYSPWNNRNI